MTDHNKNERNTCFPHTSSLNNAAQIIELFVIDNTDDSFLLVNERLLDCICFADKQQSHILFFE
jgi:hypothetical protein